DLLRRSEVKPRPLNRFHLTVKLLFGVATRTGYQFSVALSAPTSDAAFAIQTPQNCLPAGRFSRWPYKLSVTLMPVNANERMLFLASSTVALPLASCTGKPRVFVWLPVVSVLTGS